MPTSSSLQPKPTASEFVPVCCFWLLLVAEVTLSKIRNAARHAPKPGVLPQIAACVIEMESLIRIPN
jgi:hypothetical protein